MRGQPGLRTVAGQWKIGQIGERLLTQLAKSEFQTGICPLFMHVGIFPTCMDFFFRVCVYDVSLGSHHPGGSEKRVKFEGEFAV